MIEERVASNTRQRAIIACQRSDQPGVLRFTSASTYYLSEIYWRQVLGKTPIVIQVVSGRPAESARLPWTDPLLSFEARSAEGWMNSGGVGMGTWWFLESLAASADENVIEVRLHSTAVSAVEMVVKLSSS